MLQSLTFFMIFLDMFLCLPIKRWLITWLNMRAHVWMGRNAQMLDRLAHLYWFTVEFGLVMESGSPKIFGTGFASSRTESILAVDAGRSRHIVFDPDAAASTAYRIDQPQPSYFVLSSMRDLTTLNRRRLLQIARGGQNEVTAP